MKQRGLVLGSFLLGVAATAAGALVFGASCGAVESACAQDCPPGEKGDKGDPGPPGASPFALVADGVASFQGQLAVGRDTPEVDLDVDGDVRVRGQLQVGLQVVSGINCVAMGVSYTDCTCPAGTAVVSGGADAATGNWIRESRPVATNVWRVACANMQGQHIVCTQASAVCARMGS
jgi:hypothetical protein